jgi:hypothetical protein
MSHRSLTGLPVDFALVLVLVLVDQVLVPFFNLLSGKLVDMNNYR